MGHIHPDCNKNIPRDRWFIGRAFQAIQDTPQRLLLLTLLPTQTMPRLAVDAPNDLPPLLQIAGVMARMTLAGKDCSSLTSQTNLTGKPKSLCCFSQAPPPTHLSDIFLLDSGPGTDGTACNPDLVRNICPATRPIAMHTNASVRT